MKIPLFVIIVALCTQSLSANVSQVSIVADEWCPFNCTPQSAREGFMIEIATKAFERHDIHVQYSIVPWDDAIEQTRTGQFSAVVGAGVEDAEDFIFPTVAQGMVANQFWVMTESSWNYNSVESLNGMKIGVIEEYSYGDDLDEYLTAPTNEANVVWAGGDNPLQDLVTALMNGEIDVIIESSNVFANLFVENGLMELFPEFRTAGQPEEPDEIYVAFSPAREESAELARILAEETAKMRESGELAAILTRYNLKDWE